MGATSTAVSFPNVDRATIHIAFGVDANYFRGMGVNIVSIIKNNPNLIFVFHVFAFSITKDIECRLKKLENNYNVLINVNILNKQILSNFSKFPCFSQHSLGTFIRILIPNLLHGVVDKVLYLDADILCMGNIEELMSIDLKNTIAAVVTDEIKTTVTTQISILKLPHSEYFNAGVMYINIDNWVKHDSQNKSLNVLTTRSLRFADQDALNVVLNGHTTYIDKKWNFRYHLIDFLSSGEKIFNMQEKVLFMHFTGPVKPWHSWCLHEAKLNFLEYQKLSSWSDMPLDKPHTARELKLFSRFLIKQGRVIEGIYWHIVYWWTKFINLKKQN
ncbi:glycosyltransferase [Glaciimonas sp. Cout2]|uniref:glycosyltransferase family 8 protein n=1 Tax=Glaciimonas sp. Cout2 TaxID=3048621 RepID=UPI002B238624|nr:glycosyltransferase [Glaciimonas sp. Cout2]MEB0010617.1 glycosyltransferase [Glaciimonas sp. Cout2]